MGTTMAPPASTLSPLRRQLCSRHNALRLVRRMSEVEIAVIVVATGNPLQPWRVLERDIAASPEIRACA